MAVERKDECVSRWNIGSLLRLHKFQTVKGSSDYASMPVADTNMFPHFTDCRPDIQIAFATNGEDLLDVVPSILKLFSYEFTGSSLPEISRYILSRFANTVSHRVLPCVIVAIDGDHQFVPSDVTQALSHSLADLYRCQNGHMQPIYLAQVTYHLAFNSNT
ncbi:hypothetical protein PHMEG_00033677 [Phytophthora megakarya]|uniref:Uncharacterized protein n=1 Tax=Phytophthora megakarya TaxID=4795 RepID=A0A225USN2_9STRA|nr:hypothetical protein PHMEG_00033677 [Phytophthora megakarya]